jgi:predicted acylesterase/phospholipase RssA
MPGVFRPRLFKIGDDEMRLVDGGLSDSLPVEYTRSDLAATHLIVSDCRSNVASSPPLLGAHLIYIRPRLGDMGPLRSPCTSLLAAVAAGEAAVTPAIEDQVRRWTEQRLEDKKD